MKKLMTFITLSAVAVSIYAQANEQPHQAHMNMPMSTGSAMQQELMQGMNQMHQDMMAAAQYKDPDVAFAAGMLPHHIGAVKMAEVELKYGKDPEMRKLAENIINAQQAEIEQMQKWLEAHNQAHMNMPMSTDSAMQQELMQGMNQMHQDMMAAAQYKDPDVAFAAGMLPHHIGAVKMAEVELKYGKDPEMRKLAENIINAQQAEIEQMQKWLEAHNKGASRSLHPR